MKWPGTPWVAACFCSRHSQSLCGFWISDDIGKWISKSNDIDKWWKNDDISYIYIIIYIWLYMSFWISNDDPEPMWCGQQPTEMHRRMSAKYYGDSPSLNCRPCSRMGQDVRVANQDLPEDSGWKNRWSSQKLEMAMDFFRWCACALMVILRSYVSSTSWCPLTKFDPRVWVWPS